MFLDFYSRVFLITNWCSLCHLSLACILQLYHAVGRDGKPLRKLYLEAIVPPFVAVLRRWRPLLAGIHELATADGKNPLMVEDRALAADALPIEVCLFTYILNSSNGIWSLMNYSCTYYWNWKCFLLIIMSFMICVLF